MHILAVIENKHEFTYMLFFKFPKLKEIHLPIRNHTAVLSLVMPSVRSVSQLKLRAIPFNPFNNGQLQE